MGKRAKKVTLKKMAKPKLETVFSCPLCSHEKCIECKMDRQKQVGTARCRVCSGGYQTVITYLSDPVDVYSEWIDVIAERETEEGPVHGSKRSSVATSVKSDAQDEERDTDELPALNESIKKPKAKSSLSKDTIESDDEQDSGDYHDELSDGDQNSDENEDQVKTDDLKNDKAPSSSKPAKKIIESDSEEEGTE